MNGLLEEKFVKMGARVVVRRPDPPSRWDTASPAAVRLDVGIDRHGEYFDVAVDKARVELQVLDVRPDERHLLLMSREVGTGKKEKFLCGHDERHWFVAAIPPGSASNVPTAKDALMPADVRSELDRRKVRRKNRHRRRNGAFVRQGEWFFVPADGVDFPANIVLRNEPLRRGNGKPHVVEYLVRSGGETVYVSRNRPNGLTELEYKALIRRDPKARQWAWEVRKRDAGVYAKGRVSHADHQTLGLAGWHRVLMNRETEAPAMRHVAFID